VLWIVALLLVLALPTAQAFVDPPTFVPAAPNSAQPITVSVRTGGCHAFIIPEPGEPPLRIERSPGIVDVIAPGIIAFDGFCINPVATNSFAIGALATGDHQVRIWIINASLNFLETTQVASAPLTVTQGPIAQSIPTLGTGAVVFVVVLVLLVGLQFVRTRRRSILLMLALLGSTAASAQSAEKALLVLLAAGPTAPTPVMLVEPICGQHSRPLCGREWPPSTAADTLGTNRASCQI
jgi:hypothetical protein